ncbi:hypothetical protein REG_1794 [Candidatus Regiella insecticola LSR1]|uniref:Uncharacterized protein n=1 Tax=Candidatus Regiella insecticola LSR1 TaxID=663321 RepID=E0WUL2_9ENTR|nr:hypothetical protein REG_1794 [Candidatus Regiella insecticola LSR1]
MISSSASFRSAESFDNSSLSRPSFFITSSIFARAIPSVNAFAAISDIGTFDGLGSVGGVAALVDGVAAVGDPAAPVDSAVAVEDTAKPVGSEGATGL